MTRLGPAVRLDKLEGARATRAELLGRMASGRYDVLHYSGHSFFDAEQPQQSGLVCAGGEILTGADLAPIASLPQLVFFNSCQSARVRYGPARGKVGAGEANRRGHGVAETLLRGGVASFVGTYWPVRDEAAMLFAAAFYRVVASGGTINAAMVQARAAVAADQRVAADRADYAFYGHPDVTLRACPLTA